jgi:lytic murein transglycosylase
MERPAAFNGVLAGALAMTLALALTTSTAIAAPACRNTEDFAVWLDRFKQEAAAQGISRQAIAAASPYLVYDQRIINIDRGQRFFAQDFITFSNKMLAPYRLTEGAKLIKKYDGLFSRAEKQYGVPAPVIVAFWGLESDFGAGMGKDHAIKSLTTLAYDCRRSDMFRGHLFDALRLIERGDLGQTQMMPSEYLKHAVDFDGDGHRNLLRSVSDVIGSTANYLVTLGWRRDEPWLQEVDVPSNLAWDQADLAIQHPRSQWAQWGVTLRGGKALPADNLSASLLLPMGRNGPAFLAYTKWNASLVYSITAAYYATRLAGAPAMDRGAPNIPTLSPEQARELQQLLARQGYDVGEIDGKIGASTRSAVKEAQLKLGMPADSYATPELISRLRTMR